MFLLKSFGQFCLVLFSDWCQQDSKFCWFFTSLSLLSIPISNHQASLEKKKVFSSQWMNNMPAVLEPHFNLLFYTFLHIKLELISIGSRASYSKTAKLLVPGWQWLMICVANEQEAVAPHYLLNRKPLKEFSPLKKSLFWSEVRVSIISCRK